MSPEWVSAIASIIMALAAAGAILRDEIRKLIFRPRFSIIFQPSQPDCRLVPLAFRTGATTEKIKMHSIRCRIKNNSVRTAAHDVEVSVIGVFQKDATGKFQRFPMGTPWNLTWPYHDNSHVLNSLPPDTERHIQIGHIIDPRQRRGLPVEDDPVRNLQLDQTLFCLGFFVKSNTLEYLLNPGQYQLRIQVSSTNAKPKRFTFNLNHTGRWFDDEKKMYSEGLGLTIN